MPDMRPGKNKKKKTQKTQCKKRNI